MILRKETTIHLECVDTKCEGTMIQHPQHTNEERSLHVCDICSRGIVLNTRYFPEITTEKLIYLELKEIK